MTACHQLLCMIPCQLPSTATHNAILTNPLVSHIWLNVVRAPYMQFIVLLMPRDCCLAAVHEILKLATWLTIACTFYKWTACHNVKCKYVLVGFVQLLYSERVTSWGWSEYSHYCCWLMSSSTKANMLCTNTTCMEELYSLYLTNCTSGRASLLFSIIEWVPTDHDTNCSLHTCACMCST